jgi:2,4-didehydro-3-deoxy-L-rhamnonate hydrolase
MICCGLPTKSAFSFLASRSYLSSIVTLEPGYVISTGTPEGVGIGWGEFLAVGDVVETEIEGLGRQRNVVVAEAETAPRRRN